jgi:hypothetical protein
LLNYPIDHINCYYDTNDRLALYLILNVKWKPQTNALIALLGKPWNVLEADYESGDFDMLLWDQNGFRVSVTNQFDPLQRDLKLLTITNLPFEELLFER